MTKQMNSSRNKSIAFIGFMGAGKTSVANLVAEKLNRSIIDIDVEIEKQFNMPTTDIFKKYGEPFFRQKEKEFTLHYGEKPNLVISLGGGAFLQEEIINFCLNHTIVIFLEVSWDAWKKRIPQLVDTRPILQNKSEAEILQLFEERQAIYQKHHIKVVTDGLSVEEVANTVLEKHEQYVNNE